MNANAKLQELADLEGFESVNEMLEEMSFDSVVCGICINPDCDYTTNVEPDCRAGYCEICNTQSVKSCLDIAGII